MTAEPLEYAPEPAVGDVTLTRSGDGDIVVTLRPSWWRVGRVLLPVTAYPFGAFLVTVGLFVGTRGRSQDPSWWPMIFGVTGFTFVLALGGSTVALTVALNPIVWTVNRVGIAVAFRRPTRIVHQRFPAAGIADVRVERLRIGNHLWKRLALAAVDPTGERAVHTLGRRAELEVMARAFRDGLGLGDDPLGEVGLPPPPPRRSRCERQVGRDTVEVELRPPRVGFAGWILIGLIPAAGGIAAHLNRQPAPGTHPAPVFTAAGLTVLAGAFLTTIALAVLYRFRRTTTITVCTRDVTLSEQSLVRPGRETWPIARVVGPSLTVRPGGRRADLSLSLTDGTSAPLVINGPARDVRYIHDTLAVALARHAPATSPVPPGDDARPV